MPGLDVPDPPLCTIDGLLRLRPWEAGDAPALVAAWHDPAIVASCAVPADPSPTVAAAWIEGWAERVGSGAALDLVVVDSRTDMVVGEVGVRRLPRPASAAPGPDAYELGWWVGADHRGQGVARRSVAALAQWSQGPLGPAPLVARVPTGHGASARVAATAGFARRGALASGHDLWVFRPGSPQGGPATIPS